MATLMNKSLIKSAVLFCIILLLIIARGLGTLDGDLGAFIEYVCMAIAVSSTILDLVWRLKKRFKSTAMFFLAIIVFLFIIIGFLIYIKVLELTDTASDVITLLALQASLPSELYQAIADTLKITNENQRRYSNDK